MNTSKPGTVEEAQADAQGKQSSEQAPPIITALVVQTSEVEPPVKKVKSLEEEPYVKKVKFYVPDFTIPSPQPLNLIMPQAKAQIEEIKMLEFLKAEQEKSEKRLKVLTPEELKAQVAELATYEAKREKMLEEVNNSTKEASMRIIKDNQPLNLIVYDMFVLKILGFSEWLELHALASKVKTSSEGLAECKASASYLRRIQVKDIVKEVKDSLKTYSSAGMDISWRDVSKNGRVLNAVVLPPQDS
ncbi:hypothetical protein Tco_1334102 [Tanacetum coccineum]